MGGFSDNYECGYWDEDPSSPKSTRANRKKIYKEKNASDTSYLNVLLTTTKHNLPKDWDIEIALEIKHNKENKDDRKTIEVYHDEVFIGYVQKLFEADGIDNTEVVNDFCFLDDELKDVSGLWDGESFYLVVK